jgi:hypothetical protein
MHEGRNMRRIAIGAAIGAGAMGLVLAATTAHASVIWDGDASKPKGAVFGNDNCDAPGTIGTTTDGAHGKVWRFHKAAGSNRCEAHGIKVGGRKYDFRNNATYYIHWSSKLTSTIDNNANFQWKSYGRFTQNFPIVLKMIGGRLTLLNRQPGPKDHQPWSKPVKPNEWNTITLGIHTSSELQGGWVELYVNGQQQTFSNGKKRWPCRTWDTVNDPKFGVYGAEGSTVDNLVDDLKIGTTLADVT